MRPRKTGGRKVIRRKDLGEYKIEGEKGDEKLYFKREETGDKWTEDSRTRNRRKKSRRDRYTSRRLGFEEYRKSKMGESANLNKNTFFVPEEIYEKQLKGQKGIEVIGKQKGMVELISRRSIHKKGRRKRDEEKRK